MPHQWFLGTVAFALAASLCWGVGTFSGGLAARHSHVFSIVIAVHAIGLILLILLALLSAEPFPSVIDIFWGCAVGIVGSIGQAAFYRALSVGHMGMNATASAVCACALPVIFSSFVQGLPGPLHLTGFIVALFAIACISRPERTGGRPEGLVIALFAGFALGGFMILLSQISTHALFWSLAVARLISCLFMLIIASSTGKARFPKRRVLPLVLLAGTLDIFGNALFVLATHAGRLDVASVLSSQDSAVTVLLAIFLLKERVTRLQAIGIVLALAAIILISA